MLTDNMNDYFGGLSGIKLPFPRYQYPLSFQNTSRLTYYASLFNSIEVNSSFYKIPRAATVLRWANEVPAGFRFTFKLFKGVTHQAHLVFDPKLVTDFLNAISPVAEKAGCILIQLPPSLRSDDMQQLHHLLEFITTQTDATGWNIAVEFRNSSWYQDELLDLLSVYRCGLVLHDKRSSAPSFEKAFRSPFIYWRFHGPAGNYAGSYEEHFLAECASYVREAVAEGKEVYVYFNNTKGDDAYHNLITLNRLIST